MEMMSKRVATRRSGRSQRMIIVAVALVMAGCSQVTVRSYRLLEAPATPPTSTPPTVAEPPPPEPPPSADLLMYLGEFEDAQAVERRRHSAGTRRVDPGAAHRPRRYG